MEVDPKELLIRSVRILLGNTKLQTGSMTAGMKVSQGFFIFTCLGGCGFTYAINPTSHEVFLLDNLASIPEAGIGVFDQEELFCVLECLADFVENAFCSSPKVSMSEINPETYEPISCFSPC